MPRNFGNFWKVKESTSFSMSTDGVCFRAQLLHFFLKHNLSDSLLSFLCAVLWGKWGASPVPQTRLGCVFTQPAWRRCYQVCPADRPGLRRPQLLDGSGRLPLRRFIAFSIFTEFHFLCETHASPGFLFCIEPLFCPTSPQFASLPLRYLQISYMSVNFSLMVRELWLGPRTLSVECPFSDGSTLRVFVSRVLVTFLLLPPSFPKNTFVQPKPGQMCSGVRQCEFESWSLAVWTSNEFHWGHYYFIWKMGR